jgi:hypothetical protein
MSAYTGPLAVVEVRADGDEWRLLDDLRWEIGRLGSGNFVVTPAGFVTDGASIPRVVRLLAVAIVLLAAGAPFLAVGALVIPSIYPSAVLTIVALIAGVLFVSGADVWPMWGKRYRRPSITHDDLCRRINSGVPHHAAPRREDADRIFLEAMAACRVPLPVRWCFYLAVSFYTAIGAPAWLGPPTPA